MSVRLYYGHPMPRGIEPPELTREELPPDGEFYSDECGVVSVKGVRLTRLPEAWCRTWLLITVDVPIDPAELLAHRVSCDWQHESYDLPVDLVNASRRRWVRDADTAIGLMLSYGEDEMGESCRE